ncbi:MAG: hypothetical protein H6907_08030 [Hyphomicrobiales bacterium]|nr:hypothetical protein [Hyphomicrobiales bacterium]
MLDCGGDAGYALGALRAGVAALRLDAPAAVRAKVAAIAAATGATVEPAGDPGPALDLDGVADPETACRDWLRLTAAGPVE